MSVFMIITYQIWEWIINHIEEGFASKPYPTHSPWSKATINTNTTISSTFKFL